MGIIYSKCHNGVIKETGFADGAFRVEPGPLQWLWGGVNDFQTKLNDLGTRAMKNFE